MAKDLKIGDVIANMAVNNKKDVIEFLRNQGIAISKDADVKEVVRSVFASLKSKKFKERFIDWADKTVNMESNFQGAYAQANGGEFDPMDAQNGGAYVSSNGALSGANIGLDFGTTTAMPTTTTPKKTTAVGDAIRGLGGIGGIIDRGLNIFQSQSERKQQQEILDAQIEAEKLRLEQLKAQGEISEQQMAQQLAVLRAQKEAPKSQTLLYVIGGIVLLGGLGTAIYFATRKK